MTLRPVFTRRIPKGLFFACSLLSISNGVQAAESTSEKDQDEWLVLVSPFVWAPSMNGQVEMAGVSTKADVGFRDVFSNLNKVFMGNVEVTNRTVGFYIDTVYAKTRQSERLFGQKLGLDITQATVAGGVYYRAYEQTLQGNTVFGEPRNWRIEPTAGLRWTKLSTRLTLDAVNFSTKKKTDWVDPFIGLRMHADLDERWTLSGEADTGGLDTPSKKTYNAQAYLGYRMYLLDHPTIVRVGYRVLAQEYKINDFTGNKFKYDVTQRGPVLGLSMRF
ncbi:hypothetical protein [Pseudomonas sp.]|uniref:hypothetical protein n=1 Tax=Pseudomonas sp. TaxID=306 RepID=UPI00261E2C4A|nr:hypothetical protein [Pseudomonas sp.]